jgi:GTP cyclohydrolase I
MNGQAILTRIDGIQDDYRRCESARTLTEEEKIRHISHHIRGILETLGLDLEDDSVKDTPGRVARMYVKEIFRGLDPSKKPAVTVFDNKFGYEQMLVEKDISFHSTCEHHLMPFFGKAKIAYFSSGKVIGLSKINRLVRYCASKPQLQERLTMDIARELKDALHTEDVAVWIDAVHLCVAARGVKDEQSSTVTSHFSGRFRELATRNEFLSIIN